MKKHIVELVLYEPWLTCWSIRRVSGLIIHLSYISRIMNYLYILYELNLFARVRSLYHTCLETLCTISSSCLGSYCKKGGIYKLQSCCNKMWIELLQFCCGPTHFNNSSMAGGHLLFFLKLWCIYIKLTIDMIPNSALTSTVDYICICTLIHNMQYKLIIFLFLGGISHPTMEFNTLEYHNIINYHCTVNSESI